MDFRLSDEQLMAQRRLPSSPERSAAAGCQIDREHRFPAELVRRMAELGFWALPFPISTAAPGSIPCRMCWRSKKSRGPARRPASS